MNILIVHGPNLNLLGEAKGDPLPYDELNARLEAFAAELGATVKIAQSNHEGVLLDALQAERGWAEAILINPAALTHTSYALRECLRILGKPTIEVHLEDIRRRETWRRKSVIKDVCEAQVMGKGLLSYLDGLERLASGKFSGLRKGKSKAVAAAAAPAPRSSTSKLPPASRPAPSAVAAPAAPAKPTKTLGRAVPAADPSALLRQAAQTGVPKPPAKTLGRMITAPAEPESRQPAKLLKSGISRFAVRERIAARLGNKITPSALATWAREQWLNLERGAATEMGQRELLSETLQSLALSATPAGKLSDHELIDMMARLE
jgi:3-dehydroquinate dehydratase-2